MGTPPQQPPPPFPGAAATIAQQQPPPPGVNASQWAAAMGLLPIAQPTIFPPPIPAEHPRPPEPPNPPLPEMVPVFSPGIIAASGAGGATSSTAMAPSQP